MNTKYQIQKRKYKYKRLFGIFPVPSLSPVPSFKKLIPGLVLLSFVLTGILAPVSLTKTNSDVNRDNVIVVVKNNALAVLESDSSGGDASGGRYGDDPPVDREVDSSPFSCGFFGNSNLLGCVGHIVWGLIFIPATYLIALSGWLFDITIAFTLSSNILDLSFARDGWIITRDLANMFFIFILLYIAIATILEIAAYNAKALLARLIIVALLLNFSLFATRVIIDASNILALAFYDRISNVSAEWDKGEPSRLIKNNSFFNVKPKGISSGLAASFNPQNLMGSDRTGAELIAKFAADAPGKLIFIFLFSAAILLTAAWAFFSVAFLFITRTAVLWFLMAVAPLAFAAIILPKTRDLFNKWWGELMSKSFCVAIFVFFLWLITKFAETSFLKDFGKGGFSTINLNKDVADDGFLLVMLMILLQFLVLLIMIVVAKQQTQKMCGAVAGFSMNIVSGLGTKAAGFLAGGVGGFALRNTLGAYAFKKSDEWNKAGYGGGGLRERLQLQAARKIAGASFDVKATKLGKTAELGEAGGKGGYSGWVKDRTAKDVAFAKSFGVGKKADVAREAFAEKIKGMGENETFGGIFNRIITGRGVLSTTQPKKAAKEIDKLLTGVEKITREEEQLDELKAKLVDIANNPIEIKDKSGSLKKFDKIRGAGSIREAIEKGELDAEEAEEVVDASVKQHFDDLDARLDDARGKSAKANRQRTPEELSRDGRKIAKEIESAAKEVSEIERKINSVKEIKRLDERKETRGKEATDKA